MSDGKFQTEQYYSKKSKLHYFSWVTPFSCVAFKNSIFGPNLWVEVGACKDRPWKAVWKNASHDWSVKKFHVNFKFYVAVILKISRQIRNFIRNFDGKRRTNCFLAETHFCRHKDETEWKIWRIFNCKKSLKSPKIAK